MVNNAQLQYMYLVHLISGGAMMGSTLAGWQITCWVSMRSLWVHTTISSVSCLVGSVGWDGN